MLVIIRTTLVCLMYVCVRTCPQKGSACVCVYIKELMLGCGVLMRAAKKGEKKKKQCVLQNVSEIKKKERRECC